jgi:hypothetical protein
MVINNKIAFVAIPKNASWSVENTCIDLNLNLRYSNIAWENEVKKIGTSNRHIHTTIQALIDTFGTNLDYVCIIRNSTDRFISAWRFFITQSSEFLDYSTIIKLKNTNNDFIINFIKNNYYDFISMYADNTIPKKLFIKLINELEFPNEFKNNNKLLTRFSLHMLTFVSQYHWILNDSVKVKQFHFDDIPEFEKYMSEALDVNFKLVHDNQTKLDYCSVTKTPELIEFVDRYIDGAIKQTKSIL